MPKRQKKRIVEHFYFTIDDWTRNFRFEVNRHKWEMQPDDYAEHDEILIAGRLCIKTKRKFTSGEAHLLPSFVSRKDRENGADRIGNVWTKLGRIYCSTFIPADVFYSLPQCLAAGKFVQMEWRVNDLKYRRGEMDGIWLRPLVDVRRRKTTTAPGSRTLSGAVRRLSRRLRKRSVCVHA